MAGRVGRCSGCPARSRPLLGAGMTPGQVAGGGNPENPQRSFWAELAERTRRARKFVEGAQRGCRRRLAGHNGAPRRGRPLRPHRWRRSCAVLAGAEGVVGSGHVYGRATTVAARPVGSVPAWRRPGGRWRPARRPETGLVGKPTVRRQPGQRIKTAGGASSGTTSSITRLSAVRDRPGGQDYVEH